MAKPYQEGSGWCVRARYLGHDIYLSGHARKSDVEKALTVRKSEIDQGRAPRAPGPQRATLAVAMQLYALERLRFLKGAVQEARRFNHYLRYEGLEVLEVRPVPRAEDAASEKERGSKGNVYFEVTLKAHTTDRDVPNSLAEHRKAQLTKNAGTEKHRAVLAGKRMADITRSDIQKLINAMVDDKNAAATVALERAMLRGLFNYASTSWRWLEHQDNPCTKLKMPKVENVRKRRLSPEEEAALDIALKTCRNRFVAPTIALLRETAMRTSEPLLYARWKNVDWERCVLTLDDGKTGGREVPLTHGAIAALKQMEPGAPDEPILRLTYESLRSAFNNACKRAGIQDLQLYDLRRTGATRAALKTGNVFIVQKLTGHKTLEMAMRYMDVHAEDVVAALNAPDKPVLAREVTGEAVPVAMRTAPAETADAPYSLTMEQLQAIAAMVMSGRHAPGGMQSEGNVVQLPQPALKTA